MLRRIQHAAIGQLEASGDAEVSQSFGLVVIGIPHLDSGGDDGPPHEGGFTNPSWRHEHLR